ncbi:hypothetical protein SI65_03646 [Aspergillus cristatus]|uniref:Uncharacterized protein n=1 Tax=Aspergillus cristatus TaxID=573508 RepID=A0A1E3BI01_ASPCR|nr:hypothetical protein SI65_03646 [Aspergillus cristatus]
MTLFHPSVMKFISVLIKVEMPQTELYLFDKDCLVLPPTLKQSLPSDIVQAFNNARWAASHALQYIKVVERNYNKRFNAMCPLNNPELALNHIGSVSRLLGRRNRNNTNFSNFDPTLAPAAKLDPSTIKLTVDQRTYDEYAKKYIELLEGFLENPYRLWLEAKADVESRVANANFDEMQYSYWHRFWDLTFLVEMQKWEGRLQGLILPSWEEVMDDLRRIVLECVDSPHSVLKDTYDRSGILWKEK